MLALGALGGLGVAALALGGRGGAVAPEAAPFTADKAAVVLRPGAPGPLAFETGQVARGAHLPPAPVSARVTTIDASTAPSFAPLDGRVAEVAVRLGDRVKKGDRLVLVRTGELAGMRCELRASELEIATKQALVNRVKLLVESRAASQNELLVAESELNEARLAAQAAGARLSSLAVGQEGETGYWVLANRDGAVVQLDAVTGKQVGPDKDKPVATVADLDEVLVLADVSQNEAGALARGAPVEIRLPGSPAAPVAGRVEAVSDVLDPERQTVPVRVRAKNVGGLLRPHSYVEATLLPPEGDSVLLVPSDALASDGSTSVVFVESAPGSFRRQPVRLGRQTRDRAEVLEGLSDGDRIVVRGALLLLNAVGAGR
jgi:cobalt-zinc-cadmium efflux system membrane fusion protein